MLLADLPALGGEDKSCQAQAPPPPPTTVLRAWVAMPRVRIPIRPTPHPLPHDQTAPPQPDLFGKRLEAFVADGAAGEDRDLGEVGRTPAGLLLQIPKSCVGGGPPPAEPRAERAPARAAAAELAPASHCNPVQGNDRARPCSAALGSAVLGADIAVEDAIGSGELAWARQEGQRRVRGSREIARRACPCRSPHPHHHSHPGIGQDCCCCSCGCGTQAQPSTPQGAHPSPAATTLGTPFTILLALAGRLLPKWLPRLVSTDRLMTDSSPTSLSRLNPSRGWPLR